MSQPESLLPKERIERNLALHRAAGAGDMIACETLLSITQPAAEWNGSADAWYADEAMLGWDALHYAADGGHPDIIKLLLKNGALWNAVDELGFTAADIAWSRNYTKCYDILFQEGVRQSFLVPVIARHAKLDDESMEMHAEHQASREDENGSTLVTLKSGSQEEVTYSNAEFLKSKLTFMKDENGQWRCLDKDNNMVMAEWENEIMHASAKVLCEDQPRGFSILNVGFGLGIIDEMIQTYKPRRHVIIEPHPDAIAFMREQGWDQRAGVEIFEGTWEDFLQPENDEDGSIAMKLGVFDAIYFDTYSQDYQDLRRFFECLPNVLSGPDSRFSFFHGLAATNGFFYNIFTRVAELDLREIGLETKWHALPMSVKEDTWKGIKRKYWTLDEYYLPVSHMRLIE
ncbi:type IV protein arginine methyltransferase [Malassezia restricta]|uniref:type IV protein arginine methyltransferase n=1 Tax=Malassezia restricta TaxID=76775 RepID=UPI000DD1052F|nr:type IV protein arginine methyltransferase [Malassezia restricta]AXA49468.1 type IV protein arginine methyltransferase [Malassezia restricta]